MEPRFFGFVPTVFALMFSIIPVVIGFVALYFVIKYAVKNALKEHEQDRFR